MNSLHHQRLKGGQSVEVRKTGFWKWLRNPYCGTLASQQCISTNIRLSFYRKAKARIKLNVKHFQESKYPREQVERTCEDDGIVGVVSPELDEMDDVTEPEAGVAAEHDARLEPDVNIFFNYQLFAT